MANFTEIGIFDAKTRLSEILRKIEQGERFTITVRGRAVADLVPSEDQRSQRTAQAVEALLKMPKIKGVSDATVRAWIEEGRK